MARNRLFARDMRMSFFDDEGGAPVFSNNIETLEVIIGSPPAIILSEARIWAEENSEQIWAEWHKLNRR